MLSENTRVLAKEIARSFGEIEGFAVTDINIDNSELTLSGKGKKFTIHISQDDWND